MQCVASTIVLHLHSMFEPRPLLKIQCLFARSDVIEICDFNSIQDCHKRISSTTAI